MDPESLRYSEYFNIRFRSLIIDEKKTLYLNKVRFTQTLFCFFRLFQYVQRSDSTPHYWEKKGKLNLQVEQKGRMEESKRTDGRIETSSQNRDFGQETERRRS